MESTGVFNQMTILIFVVITGYTARKLKILDEKIDGALVRLVLNFTLPAVILASVLNAKTLLEHHVIIEMLVWGAATYALMIALAFLTSHLMCKDLINKQTYTFMAIFGNTGFLGFPVIQSLYGSEAVLLAAIFNIPFNVLVFSLGLQLIKGPEHSDENKLRNNKNSFLNTLSDFTHIIFTPAVISAIFAMIFALFGLHNVAIVGPALQTLGDFTTPATLMLVGSSLAQYRVREMLGNWRAYVISAVRILGIPLVVLIIGKLVISDPLVLSVLVVLAGTPVATNSLMLAMHYKGDIKTVTQGLFISTVASVFTLPLLATIVALVV